MVDDTRMAAHDGVTASRTWSVYWPAAMVVAIVERPDLEALPSACVLTRRAVMRRGKEMPLPTNGDRCGARLGEVCAPRPPVRGVGGVAAGERDCVVTAASPLRKS